MIPDPQPAPWPGGGIVIHASAVAIDRRALVIVGASGSGKSALALEMMGFGAKLVADDAVWLRSVDGALIAQAPPTLTGMIEARGIGLLVAEPAGPAPVAAIADLDEAQTVRLPEHGSAELAGVILPVIARPAGSGFAAAMVQFLKGGLVPT